MEIRVAGMSDDGENGRGASIGIAKVLVLGAVFYVVYFVCVGGPALAGIGVISAQSLLVSQVVPWFVAIWVGVRMGGSLLQDGSAFLAVPKRLWLSVALASFGAAIVLPQIASLIPVPDSTAEQLSKIRGIGNFPLALSVGVVAPLAEEVFFRGLVLRGFLARYSRTKAVWASALLFALFHLNLWQAVIALPLGVGYAYLAIRTGSLWPGILSHAVVNLSYNFLTPKLLQLFGYSESEVGKLEVLPYQVLMLGIAGLAIGTFWAARELGDRSPGLVGDSYDKAR